MEEVINNPLFYSIKIKELLIKRNYKPSKSRVFKIIEGISRKERIITKPKFFPDQIIHLIHCAIMLQIEQ